MMKLPGIKIICGAIKGTNVANPTRSVIETPRDNDQRFFVVNPVARGPRMAL